MSQQRRGGLHTKSPSYRGIIWLIYSSPHRSKHVLEVAIQRILGKAYKLRDTNFGINRDYYRVYTRTVRRVKHILIEPTIRPENIENSQSVLQSIQQNPLVSHVSDIETVMDSDKSKVDSSTEMEPQLTRTPPILQKLGVATDNNSKEVQRLQSMVVEQRS